MAELPELSTLDDRAVVAVARASGLAPLPLAESRIATTGPPGFVIGYAVGSRDQLATGVAQLADLIRTSGSP